MTQPAAETASIESGVGATDVRPFNAEALRIGGIAALASLLVSVLGAFILEELIPASASGDSGSGLPGGFRLGAWIFTAAFGAPVTGRVTGNGDLVVGSMSLTAYLPIALPMAVALGVAGILSWRAQRDRPGAGRAAVVISAAVSASVIAVVAAITAKISQQTGSYGLLGNSLSGTIGVATVRAGLFAFILVFLGALIPRVLVADRRYHYFPAWARLTLAGPARSTCEYLVCTAVVGSAIMLIVALVSGLPLGVSAGLWAGEQPLTGIAAGQFGSFVPLRAPLDELGQLSSSSISMSSPGVSAWFFVLVLVPVVSICFAGARSAFRRPASPRIPWAEGIATGSLTAVATLLVDWYLSASGRIAGSVVVQTSDHSSISVGLDAFLAFAAAFVTGLLLPVVGWWLAPRLAARAPALAQRIASGAHFSDHEPGSISRRTKVLVGGVSVLVLLVVTSAVVVNNINSRDYTADSVVRAYLAAIQKGDAGKAMSYAQHPETGPLLTNAVLAEENRKGGIGAVRVGKPVMHGGTATVQFTYTIDGESTTDQVDLVRSGKVGGLFDRWRIVTPTADLKISNDSAGPLSTVVLNGVNVDATKTLSIFPGTFAVSGGSKWYDAETNDGTVRDFSDPATISVTASLNASAKTAARKAINDSVNACLKSTKFEPTGCPFFAENLDFNGGPDPSVKWTLTAPVQFGDIDDFDPGKIRWEVTVPAHDAYTVPATTGLFASPATPYSEDVPSYDANRTAIVDLSASPLSVSWDY